MKIKPNLKKSFNIIAIFAVFIWRIQSMGELFICTVFNFFLLLKKNLRDCFPCLYIWGDYCVSIFSNFFLAALLLLYEKVWFSCVQFCLLLLCWKALIHFKIFLVESLGSLKYMTLASVSRNNLISQSEHLVSFSCLITLIMTPSTILKRNEQTCLISSLKLNYFCIASFSIIHWIVI